MQANNSDLCTLTKSKSKASNCLTYSTPKPGNQSPTLKIADIKPGGTFDSSSTAIGRDQDPGLVSDNNNNNSFKQVDTIPDLPTITG